MGWPSWKTPASSRKGLDTGLWQSWNSVSLNVGELQ